MWKRSESWWARYGVAILSIVVATGLRVLLRPVLGDGAPFATVFVAIVFSAWYGGFGPTIVTAILGWPAVLYFLLPANPPPTSGGNGWLGIFFYVVISLGIATLGGLMRRGRLRIARQMEELHGQREQLRATLSSIGDAVVVTDGEARVTLLNPVAEALTGWSAADSAGLPLEEVFVIVNEQTGATVESPVARVLREGVVVGLANHTVLIAKDGARRPIDDSAAPIRNHQGQLVGVVLVFRDITDRRNVQRLLEESERRFRMMADAAPVLIWMSGLDKKCDYFNQTWLDFTGRTLEKELGEGWTDGVHPHDLARCLEIYTSSFDARQPFRMEYRLRRHDGQYRWVLNCGVPRLGAGGEFAGYIGSCLDITERKEAEEATARLAAIVESSDDAIVGKSLDGMITSWNAGAERLYGYPAEEIVGRPFSVLIPPERVKEVERTVTRLAHGERLDHFETVRLRKDGRHINVSVSYSPLRDREGRLTGTAVIARDITDRKRAEQTGSFLAEVSEALSSVVDLKSTLEKVARLSVPYFADWCTVDLVNADGQLQRMAIANLDPANVKSAQAIYQKWRPDPEHPHGSYKVLKTGAANLIPQITDGMLAAANPDPEALALLRRLRLQSYLGVPLTSRGKTLGVVEFFTAESGRRYDQSDLEVAREFARRAAIAIENAELYQALRAADRRKDEFLALLAHELRNPLAPIASALNIMKEPAADTATIGEARDMAERQLSHLKRLVDDLLDVSRIMRGKIELRKERVELAAIVARAVETVRPLIDPESHELTVTVPPSPVWLEADVVRMAQVLSNLLSNAVKYTPAPGRICLGADCEDGQVVIFIRDTGIGIAPEAVPRLFEMFMQVAPGTSQSQGGLGIGLTLVKSLVEMHGGTVEVKSAGLGQGSEFVIRLAAAAADSEAKQKAPTPPPRAPAPGRRLLVVDDNVDAAQSLAMLLRLHGHAVRVAHSGEEALAAIQSEVPELVLLDIGMPGMNGYEVARRVREQYGPEQPMLVALTGWGQEQDRRRSKEAGFDHHLTKPVELATLRTVIAGGTRGADLSPA